MPNVSLYCALDARDRPTVEWLAHLLAPAVGGLKLGLEYFCAHGPAGVSAVRAAGRPLFPRPQAARHPEHRRGRRAQRGRAGAALSHHPRCRRRRHDAGGAGGCGGGSCAPGRRPAQPARRDRAHQPRRRGVGAAGHRGLRTRSGAAPRGAGPRIRVGRRCRSPHEVATLRAAHGPDFAIVVPGIRPASGAGSGKGDQARVATPADAARSGATALVVGRPITQAPDPLEAARAIVEEIAAVS